MIVPHVSLACSFLFREVPPLSGCYFLIRFRSFRLTFSTGKTPSRGVKSFQVLKNLFFYFLHNLLIILSLIPQLFVDDMLIYQVLSLHPPLSHSYPDCLSFRAMLVQATPQKKTRQSILKHHQNRDNHSHTCDYYRHNSIYRFR